MAVFGLSNCSGRRVWVKKTADQASEVCWFPNEATCLVSSAPLCYNPAVPRLTDTRTHAVGGSAAAG